MSQKRNFMYTKRKKWKKKSWRVGKKEKLSASTGKVHKQKSRYICMYFPFTHAGTTQ